jgi:hypothetical protein
MLDAMIRVGMKRANSRPSPIGPWFCPCTLCHTHLLSAHLSYVYMKYVAGNPDMAIIKNPMGLQIFQHIEPLPLLTKKIRNKLIAAGIQLTNAYARWEKSDLRGFDSRDPVTDKVLSILFESNLGERPVGINLFRYRTGYDNTPYIAPPGVLTDLFSYISGLNVERCGHPAPPVDLGVYRKLKDAVPVIMDVLRHPPQDKCPLAYSLGKGSFSAELTLCFKNAVIVIDMFQE